jgi:hypothetical protein
LKPGGLFYAATNGEAHLREIPKWIRRVKLNQGDNSPHFLKFSLENAFETFLPSFDCAPTILYPDSLWVTEAQTVRDDISSITVFRVK